MSSTFSFCTILYKYMHSFSKSLINLLPPCFTGLSCAVVSGVAFVSGCKFGCWLRIQDNRIQVRNKIKLTVPLRRIPLSFTMSNQGDQWITPGYRYHLMVYNSCRTFNQGFGSGSASGSGSAWIRINLSCWIRIRIRIQIADPDPDPGGEKLP